MRVVLVLFTVFFLGWLLFKPFGAAFLVVFSDITLATVGWVSALTITLLAFRMRGRDRLSWRLIGTGMLCAAGGQSLWAYNELLLGRRMPSPSLSDFGYLAMIPLMFVGLVTLPGGASRVEGRLKVVFDALIAMASIATLSWFAVLGPLYILADNTWLDKVLTLLLPAGDILYLFAIVGGISRGWIVRRNPIITPLVIGFTLFVAADLIYTYLNLHGAYGSGNVIDIGWPLGGLFLTYAAVVRWSRGPAAIVLAPVAPRRWLGFVQRYGLYGVVLGVVALLYGSHLADRTLEQNIFTGLALSTVLLVLARQLVTVRENERLNRQLRGLSDRLEGSVVTRTASLTALHDLATTLSAAASAGEVAEAGLEALRRAAGGVAAVFFLEEDGVYVPVAAHPAASPPPAAPTAAVLANVYAGVAWRDQDADDAGAAGAADGGIWWVPVSEGGKVYGCSAILGAERSAVQDTQTLVTMGAELGVAYENQRRVEASRASDARFRSLVQNSSDIITVVDADGTIRYQSPSIERVFGERPDAGLGTNVTDRVHPSDVPRVMAFLAAARPGGTATVEWRRRHHGGAWLSTETVAANLLDVPAVRGIVFNTRDISEHKRATEEARRAQAAAEAAHRTKSEFLANMSHEIRTPMNAILGMADLLAETPLDPEQQEYVGIFRRAGDSLMTLLNDILDLSKVEAGRLKLERAEFDPAELVERAVEVLAAQAHAKGLALTCEITSEIPRHVRGDPQRLRQVLLNVLGNAIKFTASGEVVLRVECVEDAHPPGDAAVGGPVPPAVPAARPPPMMLRFSVRDTGIGIDASQLEAVFGAFTQVDASATRRFGGTGLGLTIVRRMVTLMGGRVWATSRPGQGATVTFVVPLEAGVLPGEAVTAPTGASAPVVDRAPHLDLLSTGSPAAATPTAPHHPRRLLLVDDSADNRRLVQLYLKRHPYTLETAVDGRAGLAAVQAGDFDLVLMDVHMPVMDGLEATRAIRTWEQAGGRVPTPIVALTASVMAEDIRWALEAGCDAHVAKPVKKPALLEAIERYSRADRVPLPAVPDAA